MALLLFGAMSAVVWIAAASWWRARRLGRQDPPTADELEAVRSLRTGGSFQVPSGASAAARHFEQHPERYRLTRHTGALDSQLRSWRDRRGEAG